MKVLIWTPPWPTQNHDLFFGRNAFVNHLLKQANLLAACGHSVTVAVPDHYKEDVRSADNVEYVTLSSIEAISTLGKWRDPSQLLYERADSGLERRIANWLEGRLPANVDCVLLWETPIPYLKAIYPDALFVHQMPSGFARPPYPHMVLLDTSGLYRDSTLHEIVKDQLPTDGRAMELAKEFSSQARTLFEDLKIVSPEALRAQSPEARLVLLPLQISSHYAFAAETGCATQAEYAIRALSTQKEDERAVITQYVSSLYAEQVMTPLFRRYLDDVGYRYLYRDQFDVIPSVSQFLIPDIDKIQVATSGLAQQALLFDVPISVVGDTHLSYLDEGRVQTTLQRQTIISFELSKRYVLSSKLTEDGTFLSDLLEDLYVRRNMQGASRLANFADIDKNHVEDILGSFRVEPVRRAFTKNGIPVKKAGKAQQFRDWLNDKSIQLVSFDLFDTLVRRGFEQPADLYKLLALELRRRNIEIPFDFAEKRLSAEIGARQVSPINEITLTDIYARLVSDGYMTLETARACECIEEEVEVSACQPRPIGMEMFQIAKESGRALCITSDMYLSRSCIDKILQRNGLIVDAVYLSSEIGKTKKSGEIFKHIATSRDIAISSISHVGDNMKTDIHPAEAHGVRAFHVPRSVEYLWRHPALKECFPKRPPITSLARSVVAAAIAHKLFDDPRSVNNDSISGSDPVKLGYSVLGPLLYGFGTWLHKAVMDDEISDVYFLSREGKILKDAFDLLRLDGSLVRSHYLLGSRRAIRVAQLETLSDILELANQTIDHTATLGSLLRGRFGLEAHAIRDTSVKEAGFASLEDVVDNSRETKQKLFNLLRHLQNEILNVAASEREVYREYLGQVGLLDPNRKVAVVDVGWNANMQGSLGQIIGRPISGYYFATLDAVTRWKETGHRVRGYYCNGWTVTRGDPILDNRLMLEHMLCEVRPSLRRLKRGENGIEPDYGGASSHGRMTLVGPIHRGGLAFIHDIVKTLGPHVQNVEVQSDIASLTLRKFLSAPSEADAKIFLNHPLDDAFSGLSKRSYLHVDDHGDIDRQNSYWKAGADAVISAAGNKSKNEHLKAGAKNDAVEKSPVSEPLYISPLRRPLVPIVRQFVKILGDKRDIEKYDRDPAGYFRALKTTKYVIAGKILFPDA